MKLAMHSHAETSSGHQDEIEVGIEANSTAFFAQISGLAGDKIGYPIRELSTNAWDASRGDFDVYLPTVMYPEFRVRDRGPGMTPDQMTQVYATLYASTKRASDADVGGWGLGSKSPFAYLLGEDASGAYTVTSWTGGFQRTYTMSMNASGKPVLRKMIDIPSEAPSGFEVRFPVRREDFDTFAERARQILWSFEPRPRVFPDLALQEARTIATGTDWTLYAARSVPFNGPQLRMGCVMYPIDTNRIAGIGALLDKHERIVLDAPIGSVSVTLSREALAYDGRTKETLLACARKVADEMVGGIDAAIADSPTWLHACKAYAEATTDLGSFRQSRTRAECRWNSLKLYSNIGQIAGALGGKSPVRAMLLDGDWANFGRFERQNIETTDCVGYHVVLQHNTHASLARFVAAGLVGSDVLWIRCPRDRREDVLADMGNPSHTTLDDMKVVTVSRGKTAVRHRRTLENNRVVVAPIDMDAGGIFVHGFRRGDRTVRYVEDQSLMTFEFDSVVRTARSLDVSIGPILIRNAGEVFGPQWVWAGDHIIEELQNLVDETAYDRASRPTTSILTDDMRRLRRLGPLLTDSGCENALLRLISDIDDIHTRLDISSDATVSDRAVETLRRLGISPPQVENADLGVTDLAVRVGTMMIDQPLLALLMQQDGSYKRAVGVSGALFGDYFDMARKARLYDVMEVPRAAVSQD